VKYAFIRSNQDRFDINVMARVLGVTSQGYRAWKRRGPSARKREDAVLRQEIKVIHDKSKRTYGAPRVKASLQKQGKRVSRARTNRLMREADCQTRYKRKYVTTTNSKHSSQIVENRLNREFHAEKPNQKWVSDITYLPTTEGWLYLAVVLDLFSRKIIGWAFASSLETQLVLDALWMARVNRKPDVTSGLLHHSDRGSQYASVEYRKALSALKATCSMSRKGNCWDNAVMESFFSTLKLELDLDKVIGDRVHTRSTVFSWIEGWYNRERLHSSLGYVSPVVFEERLFN
jgi:putative transposase